MLHDTCTGLRDLSGLRARYFTPTKALLEASLTKSTSLLTVSKTRVASNCDPFLQYTTYTRRGGILSDQIPLR